MAEKNLKGSNGLMIGGPVDSCVGRFDIKSRIITIFWNAVKCQSATLHIHQELASKETVPSFDSARRTVCI